MYEYSDEARVFHMGYKILNSALVIRIFCFRAQIFLGVMRVVQIKIFHVKFIFACVQSYLLVKKADS